MSYQLIKGNASSSGMEWGNMPLSEYFKKLETTDLHEDPKDLKDYQKNVLTDLRPDPPLLASDEPRRDKHSREYLSIRYSGDGLRYNGMTPWLPDGTFLDHQFMERDPRGTALGPDMRKFVTHSKARAPLYRMYNDEDYSIPESVITPKEILDNISYSHKDFKNRWKNFATARGNWTNGYNKKTRSGADISKYTTSDVLMSLNDVNGAERADATTILSNYTRVGYNRGATPDNRFTVAQYGRVPNKVMARRDEDISRVQQLATQDQLLDINSDKEALMRSIISAIRNTTAEHTDKFAAAMENIFGNSWSSKTRKQKMKDIMKYAIMDIVTHSQPTYDSTTARNIENKHDVNNRAVINEVKFNHYIVEAMSDFTRTRNTKKLDDLRDKIVGSIADNGIYYTDTPVSGKTEIKDAGGLRKTVNTAHNIADQHVINNYSFIKPAESYNTYNTIDFEKFAGTSEYGHVRSKKHYYKAPRMNDTTESQFRGIERGFYDRAPVRIQKNTGNNRQMQQTNDMLDVHEFGRPDLI